MTRLYFIPVLLLLCGAISAQQYQPAGQREGDVPIGILGSRLGSLITIDGIRSTAPKSGNQTLIVDTIGGKRLPRSVAIWIEHDKGLPISGRISIRGYETGKWIGTPDEVIKEFPELGMTQVAWHFFHSFVVVSAISPKHLEDDSPNRPTLEK